MAERKDYSGEFDPDFRYEDLSKEALVRLVREYALIAQLLDRSVFAAVGLRYGQQVVEELAIEEWRGASPIYTERIRKIMNIEGDGVPAIFKQLQLDPGFAQHYMDVEYEVVDEHHGFFQLRSCGALLDVEPYGERPVGSMCHAIEDGTFDVTAQAVNPKAQDPGRAPAAAGAGRAGTGVPVGGHDRRRHRGPARGRHHQADPDAPRRRSSSSRRCATARRTCPRTKPVDAGAGAVNPAGVTSRISHTSVDAIDAYAQSVFWARVLGFAENPDDPNLPDTWSARSTPRTRARSCCSSPCPTARRR